MIFQSRAYHLQTRFDNGNYMKSNFFISLLTFSIFIFVACAPANVNAPTAVVPATSAVAPTPASVAKQTTVPTQTSRGNAPPTNAPTAPPVLPTPTQSAPPNTRATSANKNFTVSADAFISDLTKPVFVTHAGDGSGRLFIVEQGGRILVAENGRVRATPFLNIRDKINTSGSERGLLSVAFHPDYKNNGTFFVNYTAKGDGATVIERYRVSGDANVADANSAQVILKFAQPEPNHNGGMMAFGPDGYLYIGTGDGGGGGDQHGAIGNGQKLDTLLGKILRVDVNADAYQIPANNPFVAQANAKPEIWAYGLRNPWRFSFDRAAGDLYVADVGQNAYEEVNFQAADSRGGENYGWRLMEGTHCYNPAQNCDNGQLVKPIAEYSHDLGCSVTGGYVYRGQMFPWLVGQYLFADYCTGIAWASARDANNTWQTRQVGKFDDTISSFGQDENGELYVVGHGSGTIYKLSSAQ